MTDTMLLLGVEDMRAAGRQMQSAAEQMNHAAHEIEDSLDRHRRWMDEWLSRFEQAVALQTENAP